VLFIIEVDRTENFGILESFVAQKGGGRFRCRVRHRLRDVQDLVSISLDQRCCLLSMWIGGRTCSTLQCSGLRDAKARCNRLPVGNNPRSDKKVEKAVEMERAQKRWKKSEDVEL
jgi:hypothetical protein